MIKRIKSLLILSIIALCAFFGLNIKTINAQANKLSAGSEIAITGLEGNLSNINIKIEFTTNVNLDGNNNALLVGLVAADGTLLTDARFVVSSTNSGVFDENGVSVAFQNAPKTIGTKTSNNSNYTYKIETRDFNVVNNSKNIAKLVIIGQKGTEINSEVTFSEVKYSVKFGNNDEVLYSYNAIILGPTASTYTYDINGHKEVSSWTGNDSSTFTSSTTHATKDITYSPNYGNSVNHSWTDVAEVKATRNANGVKAYQVCSVCGAMRLNSSSTKLATEDDLKTTHTCDYNATFDWTNATTPGDKPVVVYTCKDSNCGYSHTLTTGEIKMDIKPGTLVQPTYSSDGSCKYVATATYEGKVQTDEKSYTLPKLTHTMTHHNAAAPSCTKDGTVEYWSCSDCNKNFSDEYGLHEITSIIDPKHHTLTKVDAKDPTPTTDGNIEYYHCSVCKKNFSDSEGTKEVTNVVVTYSSTHVLTKHNKVDATCTTDGNIEYWSCSHCNKNFSDANATKEVTDVIIKKHHELTKVNAKAATPTENGNIEFYHCSKCNKNFSDSEGTKEVTDISVVYASHVLTYHPEKEATCTEDGNYEYYSCSHCNKNFVDSLATAEIEDVVIPKHHQLAKYVGKAATCEKDGNIEYYHCSECNKNFRDINGTVEVEDVTINAKGHQYGNDGRCSVCGSTNPNYKGQEQQQSITDLLGCTSSFSISGFASLGIIALVIFKKKKRNLE